MSTSKASEAVTAAADAIESEMEKFPQRLAPLIDALLAASMEALKESAIHEAEVRGAMWALEANVEGSPVSCHADAEAIVTSARADALKGDK